MKRIIVLLSILTISLGNDKKYCDIKGNINNPGVYEIKENYTIKDIVNDAGGLKKNSYTDNINLSKKVTDEMVIYIFNKQEINESKSLNNCKCKPTYKYTECDISNEENPSNITTTTTTKQITTQYITTTNTISTIKITEDINKLININTATKEELEIIKGIGSTKAESIIKYRETNGLFKTIEDLLNVNGIGNATLEKIREYITI